MYKYRVLVVLILISAALATAGEDNAFEAILEPYEQIRQSLIADSMDGVQTHGQTIASTLAELVGNCSPEATGATDATTATIRTLLPAMAEAADVLARSNSIEEARNAFYELSKPLVRWRQGLVSEPRPSVAYCSMHKRSWLQPGKEVGNPYGNMPKCGRIVSE